MGSQEVHNPGVFLFAYPYPGFPVQELRVSCSGFCTGAWISCPGPCFMRNFLVSGPVRNRAGAYPGVLQFSCPWSKGSSPGFGFPGRGFRAGFRLGSGPGLIPGYVLYVISGGLGLTRSLTGAWFSLVLAGLAQGCEVLLLTN